FAGPTDAGENDRLVGGSFLPQTGHDLQDVAAEQTSGLDSGAFAATRSTPGPWRTRGAVPQLRSVIYFGRLGTIALVLVQTTATAVEKTHVIAGRGESRRRPFVPAGMALDAVHANNVRPRLSRGSVVAVLQQRAVRGGVRADLAGDRCFAHRAIDSSTRENAP